MKLKNIGYAVVVAATAVAFVIGSAVPGEAKGKKKPEAAPKTSASCMFSAAAPVCGAKGKMKFTYRNACWAGNDGAVVSSQKACPAKKAMKSGKKKAKKMKK